MNNEEHLLGANSVVNEARDGIDFFDPKINFVCRHIINKNVLDLGCVQHNPENYKSPYWLHKAIKSKAKKLLGLDLYSEGVNYLNSLGFNISVGNAESFELNKKFDAIVIGDLIEHLSNPGAMLECCFKHLNDDGIVIIITPNPWYWRFNLKALFIKSANPNKEHTCWFCLDTLTQLLSRYNFSIDEVEYATVQYGYKWRKILDNFLPLPVLLKRNSIHLVIKKIAH